MSEIEYCMCDPPSECCDKRPAAILRIQQIAGAVEKQRAEIERAEKFIESQCAEVMKLRTQVARLQHRAKWAEEELAIQDPDRRLNYWNFQWVDQ